MTPIIGIDPGLSGAIAWLSPQGISYVIMPTMKEGVNALALTRLLKEIVHRHPGAHVFIEKAQAMPKQGVTSMFNYGVGFGMIIGVCQALELRTTLVRPREWTKVMHAGVSADMSAKDKSYVAAVRLLPSHSFLATERSSKPHKGLIDAALIALYGQRALQSRITAST